MNINRIVNRIKLRVLGQPGLRQRVTSLRRLSRSERRLRRALVARVMGNEATADRLEAFERTRAPRASREQHLRSALDRLARDRR